MNGELPTLIPVLPELVMAIGAMALLMLGVFQGDKSYTQVSNFSLLVLLVAGITMLTQVGGERQVTLVACSLPTPLLSL